MCLSFYYHMYGEDIGAFAVFFVDNNEISRQLWNISGNQGQGWQFRQLEIDILETFQIVFQATRGPGFRSDAAIDDVNLISGPCAPVLECDFEIDFCSFMNPNNTDDFDWSRNKGATLTHITGPSRDHTSGDGFYAYIETSIPRHRGDSADLVTPVMNGGTSGYCIAFWYHMFGPNVDTLSVKLRDETGNDTVVWSAHGEQGSEWIFQELMILGKVGLTQIVFEAMVGASYGGDIALDDIRIVLGQC
ncbi:hypothetical protein ACJMK2_033941 [Sinanodonta woodiana]|uniref:MAM domain-containing protein n=1 Tax=Sinanodonta woodiana TaxID=1069815 RepID=A0ABD3WRU4_SINWO